MPAKRKHTTTVNADASTDKDITPHSATKQHKSDTAKPTRQSSSTSSTSDTNNHTPPTVHPATTTPDDKHAQYLQQQRDREATLQKVNALTATTVITAKRNIYDALPQAMVELSELYTQHRDTQPSSFVLHSAGATVNQNIDAYINLLQKHITHLITLVYPIKLWLQCSLPKLSDQKNLSVTVREELISMLNSVKNNGIDLLDSFSKYYASRGKLVTKALKHGGGNSNYVAAIVALDGKQWFGAQTINLDLRNNVCVIYDMITKNWHNITVLDTHAYTEMF